RTGEGEGEDVLAGHRLSPWSAPERCADAPASEACDVYSVGATIFFALTGEAPRGDRPLEELAKTDARALRDGAPRVGEAVARVADHALCTDPAKRYGSAYAMLGDVRRVLAKREPKLDLAMRPNPSGSYSGAAMALTSRSRISNPPSRVEPSVPASSILLRE